MSQEYNGRPPLSNEQAARMAEQQRSGALPGYPMSSQSYPPTPQVGMPPYGQQPPVANASTYQEGGQQYQYPQQAYPQQGQQPPFPPQSYPQQAYPQQGQQPPFASQPYPQQAYPYPQQGHFVPPQQGQPQPFMPQQQGQPLYAPYPGYPAAQTNVVVNIQNQGPNFFVRALYFIFIGWWAGLFWLNVGYFLCLTVILLPFGLMMLNRLPSVMTLRPSGQQTSVTVSGNTVTVNVGGTQQQSMLIRAIYFLLVGWWAGFLWAYLAYFLCVSIFLLPVGLIMFNSLPLVLTLRRN